MKKKRTRRKKHKPSEHNNPEESSEMEDQDKKVDEVVEKTEKVTKKTKTTKSVKEKGKQKIEKPIVQTQDTHLDSKTSTKVKLYDPISKKYVKPKNMVKDVEKVKQAKDVINTVTKVQNNRDTTKKDAQICKDKDSFPPHYIPEMVEKGLREKLLIEGTLRINPKRYEDAFVANETSNEPDVYIAGVLGRNRALNGDVVVIDLFPESEWRVNNELVEEYLSTNELDDLPSNDVDVNRQNNSDMVAQFESLEITLDDAKDNPAECLSPIAVTSALHSTENGLVINDDVTDVVKDVDSKTIVSSEVCLPLEEIEEADFDEAVNLNVSPNNDLSESDSLDSSEEIDIVIDEVVEVNHGRKDPIVNTSLESQYKDRTNSSSQGEKQNHKANHRTRRKRGHKTHKGKDIGR